MDNKTTTTKTEYLSAFLDDEAGAFEQRRMLDELQKDDELLSKVASFSLIGEALRTEKHSVTVQSNFLAGIHEQIKDEPVYDQVQIKEVAANQSSWRRPLSGMALAASLAAVAVVGFNMNTDQQATDAVIAQTIETVEAPTAELVAQNDAVEDAPLLVNHDEAWRKRLKHYVDSHVKYASTSAIMPSVRAVSYASSF